MGPPSRSDRSPSRSRSRSRSESDSRSRSRSRSRRKERKRKHGKRSKKSRRRKSRKRRRSSSYSSSYSRSRSRSRSKDRKDRRDRRDRSRSSSRSRSRSKREERRSKGRSRSRSPANDQPDRDRASRPGGGGGPGGRDQDRGRGHRDDRDRRTDPRRDHRDHDRAGRRDDSRDRDRRAYAYHQNDRRDGRDVDLRRAGREGYDDGYRRAGPGPPPPPRGYGGSVPGYHGGRGHHGGRPRGSGFGRAADIGRGPNHRGGGPNHGRPGTQPHPHAPRRDELFTKLEEGETNLVFYGAELDGSALPCWAKAAGRSTPTSVHASPHWGAYPATLAGVGAEVMDFIAYVVPDAEELRARYAALLRVDAAAKRVWPDSQAECFGSTKHRMPQFGSDLDIRIKTGGRYENIPECQGITQMGNEIMKHQWAADCDPRTTGRVPMITYKDRPSGLRCKVCVGNRMTVRGTSFFNSPMTPLSARFPVFKTLMHPLKCIFVQRGLEKSFAGGIGTFRVGMMLLNYLAMHAPASTQQPTNEMIGGILTGFFRYYAGEAADGSPEAATWQTWPENFKFKGEFYVMGVQVDFGGCAMGEVAQVFKAAVKMLSAMPPGGNSRVTCLSRLIDQNIIADAREVAREQCNHPDNALPDDAVLPEVFVPEKRLTYAAAPVPTLPPTVFGGNPMGMGPAGAAMAAMGVGSNPVGGDPPPPGGAGGTDGHAWGGGGEAEGGGYGGGLGGVRGAGGPTSGGSMGGVPGGGPGEGEYPSPCITLKNMFDPSQMARNEQMWGEINEDVRDECSKHGEIVHMQVDMHSQGFVHVQFSSAEAAASARQTLNQRWFAGRLITCDFTPLAEYDARFRR